MFLDRLGEMFSTLPSAADATIDLDEDQITKDVAFINNYADARDGLAQLVSDFCVSKLTQLEKAHCAIYMKSTE